MARIVVTGYMVRHPVAGNVATFLQYVVGLRRLGHEVLYLEEKGWPWSCYDLATGEWLDAPVRGLPAVRRLVARHAPGVPVVFVDAEHGTVDGMAWDDLRDALAGCDLLLDVGGTCWLEERLLAPRRALVDLDPVFTQVERFGARVLGDYHVHLTVATNAGGPGCTVPDAGIDWLPTPPPVVADLWAAPPPRRGDPATTVANWAGYGDVVVDGVRLGQKDVEFRRLRDVPARTSAPVEVALSGAHDVVRDDLRAGGWRVIDGGDVTRTLAAYAAYIAGSAAEFSPAKQAYVATRSGWVSDRTVCYLAAGRPVVVQDTGAPALGAAGEGALVFEDADGAVDALERVDRDLERHSAAARRLAAERFDHRVVLPRLLDAALGAQRTRA